VGSANPSIVQHIDVNAKVAVQLTIAQGHMLFERGPVGSRADELVAKGAAGVFNLVRLPGNERSRDFSDCGNRASTKSEKRRACRSSVVGSQQWTPDDRPPTRDDYSRSASSGSTRATRLAGR
jgi:hypothetical protein